MNSLSRERLQSPPPAIRAVYFDFDGVLVGEAALATSGNGRRNGSVERYTVIDSLAGDLSAKGILAGVMANMTAARRKLLSAEGAFHGFNPVVLSCDVGSEMPDNAIYMNGTQRIGYPRANVLFVSGSVEHLEPAYEMSMQVLLATSPDQVAADVRHMISEQKGITL